MDELETGRLSPFAAPSRGALRRKGDELIDAGHRQNYQVDADRILHSKAYTRYIDKTQVFYLVKNDHISHRVLHVQLVSKISRTIGRLLRLNEDLIEAIALGHDLGHAPFGHDGEAYLSEISEAEGLGPFVHSVQSVRALDMLEKKGKGLNLSLQVLDGILCHDGEVDLMNLIPDRAKDFGLFEQEMLQKGDSPRFPLRPMTLEGCVVRLADTIAYIGRDLEDAIRLGLIARKEIPQGAARVLGASNGTIVYRLVEDLVSDSLEQDRVGYSKAVAEALLELKMFNRERIYSNPGIKAHAQKIRNLFKHMFDFYLTEILEGGAVSSIIKEYMNDMDKSYLDSIPPALVVRDFMAGMTDDFFLDQARLLLIPSPIV